MRKQWTVFFLRGVFLVSLTVLGGCADEQPAVYQKGEKWPGGKTSVTVSGRSSFSRASANMQANRRLDFSIGDAFFKSPWVAAPDPSSNRDGLGPLFNTTACEGCHIRDGRGHAPKGGDLNNVSLLLRVSVPAVSEEDKKLLLTEGVVPHPIYGSQVQDFALPGVKPEAKIRVRYEYSLLSFKDGEKIQLRKPVVTLEELGYGPLPNNLMTSVRLATPMIGLGLIESIPESSLLANEDANDQDGDGISGRANRVWDIEKQMTVVGRFGWKAGQPSLKQQSAKAFQDDMGITSSLFPEDNCTNQQTACKQATQKQGHDVSDSILNKVVFYTRNLAVPLRQDSRNQEILKGKKLFAEAHCSGCHVPQFKTARLKSHPEQSNQKIWPYSDFLLHDMGEELADNRPEFLATGSEWRTPPLWGIGKTKMVNEKASFLHDGRARTIMEAVLWHGGEAAEARDKVLAMNKQQRQLLIKFIESL